MRDFPKTEALLLGAPPGAGSAPGAFPKLRLWIWSKGELTKSEAVSIASTKLTTGFTEKRGLSCAGLVLPFAAPFN